MTWTSEFVVDLLNLSERDLFQKYDGKIPPLTRIAEVVSELKALSAEQRLVKKDSTKRDITFNLEAVGDGYEVFQLERGGKHWVSMHDSLDKAIFDKVDRIFNAMLHPAPDSVVNAK